MNLHLSTPLSSTLLFVLTSILVDIVDAKGGGGKGGGGKWKWKGGGGGAVYVSKEDKEKHRKTNMIVGATIGGIAAIVLLWYIYYKYSVHRELKKWRQSDVEVAPISTHLQPAIAEKQAEKESDQSSSLKDKILGLLGKKPKEPVTVLPTTTPLPKSETDEQVGLLAPGHGLSRKLSTTSSANLDGSTLYGGSDSQSLYGNQSPQVVAFPLPQAPSPARA